MPFIFDSVRSRLNAISGQVLGLPRLCSTVSQIFYFLFSPSSGNLKQLQFILKLNRSLDLILIDLLHTVCGPHVGDEMSPVMKSPTEKELSSPSREEPFHTQIHTSLMQLH